MLLQSTNQLLEDINKLGMPEILVNHHGFMVRVKPMHGSMAHGAIVFQGQGFVSHISLLGDVVLVDKHRPDNYIIDCERCYGVKQAETGDQVAEIFWPSKKEK